eukprot:2058469-Amphidinium_carterae.1
MVACGMRQGGGIIVTDCKGAAVVANQLQAGTRRPRGRRFRILAERPAFARALAIYKSSG